MRIEFTKRVDVLSSLIVRRVTVDRSRTAQAALKATGRNHYVRDEVVATMPKSDVEEVDVCFFNVGRCISDEDLQNEFELRGLKPADPFSLAAVNEVDSDFADDHPNATHWKDTNKKWCYAAFSRYRDERRVRVERLDRGWFDYWWFAGVRK